MMPKIRILIFIIIAFFTIFSAAGISADDTKVYIAEIIFNRQPIFKNDTDIKKMHKLINHLHITTKPSAIKKDLLFDIGDRVDIEKLNQSERNLRSRKYFFDANINFNYITDTSVKVIINTQDQWTTTLGIKYYKDERGKSSVKLILKEHNLLGLGKELKIKKDILNINDNNQDLEYVDDNFLGMKNMVLMGAYSETPYSLSKKLKLGRKCASDFDKYSYYINSIKNESLTAIDVINDNYIEAYISNGRLVDRIELSLRAHSFSNDYKNKLLKFNYILTGVNYSSYKYIKTKGLFKYGQTEDIKLGYQIGAGVKLINKILGANINGYGWEANFKHSYNNNRDFIFQNYNFDYYYLNDFSNNHLDFKIEYLHLYTENFKFMNKLTFEKRHTYKDELVYALGENKGLRGYKSMLLEGNKFLLLNSELQYIFKKELLKFMYSGINIFYDAGRTYNQGEQVKLNKFYHNVGLSFRLILYRSSSFEEFNFAIVMPFKNKYSPFFSFQTNIDF